MSSNPSETLAAGVMLVAFLALLGGSFWGAYRLARLWAKGTFARVVLTGLLFIIFMVAGLIALVAGCAMVVGTPNYK
jgi:hypothetical protein